MSVRNGTKAFSLKLLIISIFLFPSTLWSYTWNDVQNYLNTNAAPNGCFNWTEKVTINNNTGYKIWQRCNSAGSLYWRQWLAINGTPKILSINDPLIFCLNGPSAAQGYAVPQGSTVYVNCEKSGYNYYCDGTVEELKTYPVYIDNGGADIMPCYIKDEQLVNCTVNDTLLAEFSPVDDECIDINGYPVPCVEECRDPAQKAVDGIGHEELCGDGIDNNCSGQTEEGCVIEPLQNLGSGDENPHSATDSCFGSTVNFSTGNLYNEYTISIGFVNLLLSYNTLDSYNGPLGKGWTHTFNIAVTNITGSSLILMEGNGRRIKYTSTDGVTYTPENKHGEESTIIRNGDNTFTLTEKNGTFFNFNTAGKLTSVVDRNANTTTLTYSGEDLVAITDTYGRTAIFTYYGGVIISITDPLGRTYNLSYTTDMLTSITDPDGGVVTYGYDVYGRLINLKQNPGGGITTYTYDGSGRVTSATDALGNTKTIAYTGTDTAEITDRNGNVTAYLYNKDLNVMKQKTDPEGDMTAYTSDTKGNPLTTTYPDGTTVSFTYDTRGNILTVTDQTGNTTTYTYEPLFNRVSSVTDPLGRTITFNYDAKGNLVTIINPLNSTTTLGYDIHGNVTHITDPVGNTISMTYDVNGNISSTTDQLGNTTTFVSDIMGNLINLTDGNNNTISNTHDTLNRLISATDALANTTTYTYGTTCTSCGDKGDNLTSLTDANGNTTYFAYDLKGRLLTVTSPLGNTTTYSYDGEGNILSRKDANGFTTTYYYDSLNRLIQKNYPDGTGATFTYDSLGRMLTAANQNISYAFTYDPLGRITSVVDSQGMAAIYQYDALGNRSGMTTPEGDVIQYSYDSNNRLVQILPAGEQPFAFTYDERGRRTSLTYPNGVIGSYSYDAASRLAELLTQNAELSALNSYTYTHDGIGNRLKMLDPDKELSYSYDAANRLIQSLPAITNTKGNIENVSEENFSYDPVGNRLIGPKGNKVYAYNDENHLIDYRRRTYQYDNSGNLMTKIKTLDDSTVKSWVYTYDYENRLTSVVIEKDGDVKRVTFKYDPFGRRIEKKVEKVVNGETVIKTYAYFYDNEDIIHETFTTVKRENTTTSVTQYIHGPGIDEPLTMDKDGQLYYYHADGLGSITALTDASQTIVESYTYSSFGKVTRHGNTAKNSYTFTGREWDKETKLYYYRARYYDPQTGRFISKDPLGFAGGDVNLYGYVENNPVNFVDPSGLFIGSLFAKGLPYFFSGTAQEAAIAGRVGDALISVGIMIGLIEEASTASPQLSGLLGALQFSGGAQTISIGVGFVSTGLSLFSTLGVGSAGLGGWEIGLGINKLYESINGQSLGEDIYDLLHPPKDSCDR